LLNPYPLREADEFSYHVYFLDYSYIFSDYPAMAVNVYSFNLEVAEGDTSLSGEDEKVGITIVEVFRYFFIRKENVAVYVCDAVDEHNLARKRKFDLWFWKYNDGSIIKEDGMAVVDDTEILNSLLFHRKNPRCAEIILAFKDLNARAGDK
jgi:Family of unknown function (DUF6169)